MLDNKESEVKIETKKSVRGFNLLRGQGPIPFAPIDIWRALGCKEFQPEYALNQATSSFKKKIGANAYIYYN